MKRSFFALVAIFAVAAVGLGQALPPPGGSNWVLHSVTRAGHTHGYSYGYVMGVPTVIPFDLPWGVETGGPQATNTTGLPFDVKATSEGKTTFIYLWQGPGLPPPIVMVERWSSTMGSFGSAGSAIADNGIGSPMVWDGNTVRSEGTRRKIYDSHDGVVTVEVESKAEATGSIAAQVGQSVIIQIMPRALSVGILGHEPNYQRRLTGLNVYSQGGSYPQAVPEMVWPEQDQSGDMFHIVQVGLGLVARTYWDNYHPATHIDAGAYAVGDHEPTETFQWHTPLDNTSGTLPGWGNDYTFGDAGVANMSWAYQDSDGSIVKNDVHNTVDASITYTWNDGYTLTSKVRVMGRLKHENVDLFKSIHYWEDGQLTWDISKFTPLSSDPEWAVPTAVTLECWLLDKDAWLEAAGATATLIVAAGAEFPGPWQVRLICIAAGIALTYAMPEPKSNHFSTSLGKFQTAIANTPSFGQWIDIKPALVLEETMLEYHWRVLALPLYQTDWYVADKYGDNGFEGQVEDHVRWQSTVRYGYQYKRISPPPPPL